MDKLVLRDYQLEGVDALRANMRRGIRRQVLCAPTGAGKTVVAAHIISETVAAGNRVSFVADREVLVLQTSRVLQHLGIEHGIAMGSHTVGRSQAVQVCSAQTLEKRGFLNDPHLVIVDECHTVRQWIVDWIIRNHAWTVGLTATPFTAGLGKIYQAIVNLRTTNRLIEDGWIVPFEAWCGKEIDMTGAKQSGGEWTAAAAAERGIRIIGDVVTEWQKRTQSRFGRPAKTIVFGATVEHCNKLAEQFESVTGHSFGVISYHDRDAEARQAKIRALERGDLTGLISCEALAKGFDLPEIECVVMCRKYRRSMAAYVQSIGRGARAAPGKQSCLLLDHTGAHLRFLDRLETFWEDGWNSLDKGERKAREAVPSDDANAERECKGCGHILERRAEECPSCGRHVPRRVAGQQVITLAGKLEPVHARYPGLDGIVWEHISRMAVDNYADRKDRSQMLRWARMQHKSLTGEWPPVKHLLPRDGTCDPRIERDVNNLLGRWMRQQKAIQSKKGRAA